MTCPFCDSNSKIEEWNYFHISWSCVSHLDCTISTDLSDCTFKFMLSIHTLMDTSSTCHLFWKCFASILLTLCWLDSLLHYYYIFRTNSWRYSVAVGSDQQLTSLVFWYVHLITDILLIISWYLYFLYVHVAAVNLIVSPIFLLVEQPIILFYCKALLASLVKGCYINDFYCYHYYY